MSIIGGAGPRRRISREGEGVLVLKPTLLYRLQGVVSIILGGGITFYFSLAFALGRTLPAIMLLGVFWIFGILLLWAGASMLLDPWKILIRRTDGTVEVTERRALPYLRSIRTIPLQEIAEIVLRRGTRRGLFGDEACEYLELRLTCGERIEIDCIGVMGRERLASLAERIGIVLGKSIREDDRGEGAVD